MCLHEHQPAHQRAPSIHSRGFSTASYCPVRASVGSVLVSSLTFPVCAGTPESAPRSLDPSHTSTRHLPLVLRLQASPADPRPARPTRWQTRPPAPQASANRVHLALELGA